MICVWVCGCGVWRMTECIWCLCTVLLCPRVANYCLCETLLIVCNIEIKTFNWLDKFICMICTIFFYFLDLKHFANIYRQIKYNLLFYCSVKSHTHTQTDDSYYEYMYWKYKKTVIINSPVVCARRYLYKVEESKKNALMNTNTS